MPYIGTSPSNSVRRVHTYTATASQTTFTGASSEGVTLSYVDANYLDVFQNGVLLGSADYTSTSGTSVVLAQGASADDLIVIVVYDVFSVADTVSKTNGGSFDSGVTMSSTLGVTGATTLSGNLSVDGGTIKLDGNYPTATENVALGDQALDDGSLSGAYNTAIGHKALTANTSGASNTSVGRTSLVSNATGSNNTAVGMDSLANVTGSDNTAIGKDAGKQITSGQKNTIIGGYDGNENSLDIRTSDNNIVISDGDGNPYAYFKDGWFLNASITNDIAVRLQNKSSTNPYGVAIQHTANANNNANTYFLVCADTSAGRFYVYNNGDVRNSTGSYAALSDVKLKEQITDASSQWDDIKALTIRKYKMKEDVSTKGDSDDLWRLGVVAQELETAGMNGLVTEDNDTEINEDGSINELGTTTKSVKYSILYMKAVKALQEAMARIETLEAKVTALENAE